MFSLVLTLLLACDPPPPPVPGEIERTGEVLTLVNGQNVTQGMLDAALKQLPANVRDQVVARGQLDQVKEQMIIGELLYQEALKQKINEKPEVKTGLAMAARNALASALLDQTIEARSTDDAIKKYYDEHLVQFARPQVKARHILVKEKAEAEAILADLKAGGDFAKLAIEKSTDKGSGKDGGELGWFEKQKMVPEFAAAAFAAAAGDTVGPIETKYGFHIINVEEKRESVPLDEAAKSIKDKLRNEIVQAYIDELKKAATITTPTATGDGKAAGDGLGGATVAPAALQTDGKASTPDAPK